MIRIVTLLILLVGCTSVEHNISNSSEFFGLAALKADGEICLQLRSKESGTIAELYKCYKQSDPQYLIIREHVGEIAVGEEKIIAPFD